MVEKVKTIEELELLHYGNSLNYLSKADTFATTGTGGIFNTIFGAFAWANLNLEANAFSVLPKYVWDKSGFRIITGRATLTTENDNTILGGTAESGKIAEAALPTVEEVTTMPKIAQIVFGASTVHEWLANNSKDDIWGSLSSLRTYMAVQHKEALNMMLLADVESEAAAAGNGNDYDGTLNWESLDRMISSKAEEAALGGDSNNYYDPWDQLDRETEKYDSTVISAGTGDIGSSNGQLTKTLLLQGLQKTRKKGGKDPNVFLGSHEVYTELQEIFEPATRYGMGESLVEIDVNGIKTFNGHGVGLQVASVYGIPFIPTKDAPANASDNSEVGRLFALDTSDRDGFGYPRLGIQVAVPTTYNEAVRGTAGWPFINEAFAEKGVYWTMGELICRRFNGSLKIRDILI